MMTTMTKTVTVNAAFLQEIKEDNQRLRQLQSELRGIYGHRRPFGLSRFVLIDFLENYRDQLATHFALEEAFGYFDDPVDVAPHISEEVESLRSEHGDLYEAICGIVERAIDLLGESPTLAGFRDIANWLCQFDEHFQRHESRENELIMQAFNQDIGVGD